MDVKLSYQDLLGEIDLNTSLFGFFVVGVVVGFMFSTLLFFLL